MSCLTWRVLLGDVRERLADLPDASAQCVVTSPPYWGLRDYKLTPTVWGGKAGCVHRFEDEIVRTEVGRGNWAQGVNGRGEEQPGGVDAKREPIRSTQTRGVCQSCGAWRGCLGLEPTPTLYVEHLLSIFREIRRVLRDDGTLWLNLGDCYQSGSRGGDDRSRAGVSQNRGQNASDFAHAPNRMPQEGLKDKNLVGIPWRVAFALQADGWYLRSDIIWAKGYSFHPTTAGSCMPESVTDRPTLSHEYLFLLTKSARYYYDAESVKERSTGQSGLAVDFKRTTKDHVIPNQLVAQHRDEREAATDNGTRNLRDVWLINPKPYREAHFATFPPALVAPCVKAGSRPGDTVLDPFCGSGTTGVVALRLGRSFVGIELNQTYRELARTRIGAAMPLLARERTA